MRRYWTCPKGCGGRWERSLVKCRTEGCTGRRPKRRVPTHARTLRDDPYLVYERVNGELHAAAFGPEWTADCCGVCGKPPSTERHMDRDHDHLTGLPRGLACPGNQGCNALMPRQLTLARARLIVAYLERAEAASRVEGAAAEKEAKRTFSSDLDRILHAFWKSGVPPDEAARIIGEHWNEDDDATS